MGPTSCRIPVLLLVLATTASSLLLVQGFFLESSAVPPSRRRRSSGLYPRPRSSGTRVYYQEQKEIPPPSFSPLSASNANELNPMKPGSTVALVTPFEKDTGKIDVAGLRNILQYHVDQGTDNLCILGTTGEANTLSMEEREQVLTIAVDMVKGKMPILVGTGTIDPNQIKAMTEQARDLGCDASLVVTPYYVKPPQRCLIRHFTDCSRYGLPVVIYNVPGRTAVNMNDESIAICALQDNIVAVKDATGDLSRVANLQAELESNGVKSGSDFLMYSGDDSTSKDFCLQGGHGCISVTANIVPNAMHRLVEAARSGDADLADSINEPINILHKKLFCESNPIPAKYAVQRLGLIESAYCRPPLDSLDPALESVVDDALRQSGLLK